MAERSPESQQQTVAEVLLVDDHALFREGLVAILRTQPHIGGIAEAASVSEALTLRDQRFDLIVLDIGLPGISGLLGISLLREHFAGTPVLMLSADCSPDSVRTARRHGASGFVAKTEHSQAIFEAMTRVLSGGGVFPDIGEASGGSGTPAFTTRQTEVLALLCAGKPNKVIARELGLAEYTVREHVSNILAALRVSSRAEAISVALRHGLLR